MDDIDVDLKVNLIYRFVEQFNSAVKLFQCLKISIITDEQFKIIKLFEVQSEKCYDVLVSDFVSARGRIVQAVEPFPPVKDCYVCSNKFSLVLVCRNPKTIDIKILKSDILENELKMMAPNVCLQNKSTVKSTIDKESDKNRVKCDSCHRLVTNRSFMRFCDDISTKLQMGSIVWAHTPGICSWSAILGEETEKASAEIQQTVVFDGFIKSSFVEESGMYQIYFTGKVVGPEELNLV